MWTKTSLLLIAGLTLGAARADNAPAEFLREVDGVQQFLAVQIARPVYVLEANFGPHYVRVLVQDQADAELYDKYEAVPGQPPREPEAVKVGDVDCKKARIAWASFRLAGGAAALADAQALAAANGYEQPGTMHYGPDVFCKQPAWRTILSAPDNDDDALELLYGQDGVLTQARRMNNGRWKSVAAASLRAGAVQARAAVPEPAKFTRAGDGGKRDFRADPGSGVVLLERALGHALALTDIDIDAERMTLRVRDPANKKRVITYFVAADGAVEEWRSEETFALDCNTPFSANDYPLRRVPQLIEIARGSVPPMQAPQVRSVRIYRSGLCSEPHLYIGLEDERAQADVEFDARERRVNAQIR
jgi:hypothetical protein